MWPRLFIFVNLHDGISNNARYTFQHRALGFLPDALFKVGGAFRGGRQRKIGEPSYVDRLIPLDSMPDLT